MNIQRNRTIDLLKGIFAIFVITLHYPFQEGIYEKLLFPYWVQFAVPGFLFVSGYLAAASFDRNGIDSLTKMYAVREISRKILRVLIPFTTVFIVEEILFRVKGLYLVGIREYGLLALCFDWLNGGMGQGSYYFPLVLQFIFLFPLIYICVKRNGFKGVWIVFAANLAFEITKQSFGMNAEEYRLIVLRYLFVIACGCYAYTGEAKESVKKYNAWLMVFTAAVGGAFVYIFGYTGYSPKILTFWSSTSVLPALYAVVLLFLMVKKTNIRFLPVEYVGKASFHIFLVQMVFFIFYEQSMNYVQSLAFCIMAGIAFWFVERLLLTLCKRLVKEVFNDRKRHIFSE